MIEMAMIDSDVPVWRISYAGEMNCSVPCASFVYPRLKCDSRNPESLSRCKIDGMNQIDICAWRIINDDCIIDRCLPRHRRTNDLGIALKRDPFGDV